MLDVNEIMSLLPHRYPFLLVDRVLEIDPGKKITALKNVTINEPFFPGHFPGHPVMPGVLIVEAMAQTAAILVYNSAEENKGKITYFVGIDNTKFRKPVVPGDQLRFELEIIGCRRGIYTFSGKAYVEGKLVTESELRATFADKQS
ncbi:MAG: 3-hydroxyacyl-ACP dehydratase FabZ [Geobacteraceae bacterium]|nr:3-hydroxyacyl-ACP dehydratase FabZ [Geobacteraceae bacterium]